MKQRLVVLDTNCLLQVLGRHIANPGVRLRKRSYAVYLSLYPTEKLMAKGTNSARAKYNAQAGADKMLGNFSVTTSFYLEDTPPKNNLKKVAFWFRNFSNRLALL